MEQIEPTKTSISYDFADVEIIVEVFRDMLLMSAIPGYKRDFKKYNLQMLAGVTGAGDGDANDGEQRRKTVNVAELIKKRKEQQQAATSEALQEDQDENEEDDDQEEEIVYKPKIDILEEE